MSKNINVPKLRFKEFIDEWEEKELEKIFNIFQGFAFSSSDITNEGVRWLKIADVGIQRMKYDTPCFLPKIFKEKYSKFLLNKNDYVLALTRPILNGMLKIAKIDDIYNGSLLNQRVGKIITRESLDFIYYFLQQTNLINKIDSFILGSEPPNLSINQIKFIKASIPLKKEQEKIASFLTSVDTKIEQLIKKDELLQQYKKGMIQKIFNEEIRFKADDGNEFPEWEEKKLGDIGIFQTSSIDKISKDDEKSVFLINYMDVYKHKNINNRTIKNFQIVTATDSQISSCNLQKGDILFTPSSETSNDIGHSVVIFEDLDNAVYSYHLMRFRPKIRIDILYSHYFCNIPSVLNQLAKFSTGITRFTISVKSFSLIKINFPCLEEQNKIANFLSSIDDKIEENQKILQKTKEFKKSLLQHMFV
ncbi:restriction endonuclease subunit S [Arcobacter lacus]|nr:restriction endonuclease subunit S [Arcobacter lacus]